MSKVEATATTTTTTTTSTSTTSGDNLLLDNIRREKSNNTLQQKELKSKDDIEEEKSEAVNNSTSTGTSSDEKENSTTKNGSGRSTDDENYVDSVSNNLITKKDIPQDVAIAIKALGELKHSGKIINNLKNNADFVLQNSKMHLAIMNANTNKITRNVTRNIQRSLDDLEYTEKQVNRTKRTKLQGDNGGASQRNNDDNSDDDEEGGEEKEEEGEENDDDEEEDDQDTTSQYYDPVTGIFSRKRKRTRRTRRIKNVIQTHTLNLSIESKKKLFTCLHLLKLANKQLSNKVFGLQELVQQEEEKKKNIQEEEQRKQNSTEDHAQPLESKTDLVSTDHNTMFRRASTSSNHSNTRNEIIGTVKKVYTLISKFTGNSLPEPARSKVRESLLTLPGRMQTYISAEDNVVANKREPSELQVKHEAQDEGTALEKHKPQDGSYVLDMMSGNQKMLLLAKESLDMVSSVMDVVDDTLGRAEEWVKQRQELQEQLRENLRNQITNSTSSELQSPPSTDQTEKPFAHVE